MSHVSIATITTVEQAIDEVRERTDTISEEESELYFLPMANMLHDAIIEVRAAFARKDQIYRTMLKDFYWSESTVTEATNLVDISALDIWWDAVNVDELTYYDATNKSATMMTQAKYNDLKTIYSDAMMADFFLAYAANILATNNKFQLRTFRGANLGAAGALTLGYPRNPVKRTQRSDFPDCTEEMLRDVIELLIKWVPTKLKVAA